MKNEGGNGDSQGAERVQRFIRFFESVISKYAWQEGGCLIELTRGQITEISTTITLRLPLRSKADANPNEPIIPLTQRAISATHDLWRLIQAIYDCFAELLKGCQLQFGTIKVSVKAGKVSRISAQTSNKPDEDRELDQFLYGG